MDGIRKLRKNTGMTMLTLILIIAVAAAVILILIVPGYEQHLEDAKLTMDIQSVQTCEDVASVRYLQDGAAGLQIYYYDELRHQCLDRDKIQSIQPYGRCSREQNLHEETGARGIPNLGPDHGGAQLLAVAVNAGEQVNIRWTGHDWSYLDYYYMYPEERQTLTEETLRAMDRDSTVKAKKAAIARYREDFAKQLKRGEDPGASLYDYDALNDEVYYDGVEKEPSDLAAYGLSNTETQNKGCILQVSVRYDKDNAQEYAETAWVEGNHG